ncbi:MAG: hypothetical protein DHS20C01_32400 [marine bacterium B5-7]|nr:MAG: hypothetical protein DHS20C01_32400 [marine bacterium B5-7]
MKSQHLISDAVATVINGMDEPCRAVLLRLRELILETASKTDGVGPIEEALRWGQPAYLTNESKSGSLIRIDQLKGQPKKCAMYFHCQTSLVDTFRTMFPDELVFESNRAIIIDCDQPLPIDALSECIILALTYHARRQSGSRSRA